MARRSSARLRSRNSATPQPPKRVSLSHDAHGKTPKTVPAKLSALPEADEMPGSFPESPVDTTPTQPAKRVKKATTADCVTPKQTTPIKAAPEEMHPQHHHQTAVKPMEEARWLGFHSIVPATEPPKQSKSSIPLATPSKTRNAGDTFQSPQFSFTFNREHSLELSPEAKRLMLEKRGEAAKLREQMIAGIDPESHTVEAGTRKMAKPKGRFSGVHQAAFDKMASIAGHASSYRRDANRLALVAATEKSLAEASAQTPSKTPGISPSKTKCSGGSSIPRDSIEEIGKMEPSRTLPQSTSSRQSPHDLSNVPLATNSKIPSPSKSRGNVPTTSSSATAEQQLRLFARSPLKATLFPSDATVEQPRAMMDSSLARTHKSPASTRHFDAEASGESTKTKQEPLLSRSPSKMTLSETNTHRDLDTFTIREPLLSRSPLKASALSNEAADETQVETSSTPLLARSPRKTSSEENPFHSSSGEDLKKEGPNDLVSRFGFLRSTPIKSILRSPQRLYSNDPAKIAAGTHLATPPKFNLKSGKNRQSQHMPATAPVRKHVDFSGSTKARHEAASASPTSCVAVKPSKEDQSKVAHQESPATAYPTLPSPEACLTPSPEKRRQTATPGDFTFRMGDGITFGTSPNALVSGSSRRPPTIRHVSADTAVAPPASGSKKRKYEFENRDFEEKDDTKNTRVAAVERSSKKRKFIFENVAATEDAIIAPEPSAHQGHTTCDKENTPADETNDRPVKRARPNFAAPTASAAAKQSDQKHTTRRPTLGVKPKGAPKSATMAKNEREKKTTITQSRLAALAMPKKRG